MNPVLEQPCLWVVLTMLGIAAVTDLRSGLIPNSLPLLGAAAGGLVQLWAAGGSGASLTSALADMGLGLLACSIVPSVLYACGGLGGGDLKLFAAIGLCVGPATGLEIQLGAHLLLALVLPLYFLWRGGLRRTFGGTFRLVRNAFSPPAHRMPLDRTQLTSLRFAPAIFGAALWVACFGGSLP